MNMTVNVGGLILKNPVMNGSGTLGIEESVQYVNYDQLGAVVAKSITFRGRKGNPPPRLVETVSGMINSIGIQNEGVFHFSKKTIPFMQTFQSPLICSLAGSSIEEFGEIVKEIEKSERVSAYEVNISCPNMECGGKSFGLQKESTYKVTKVVRENTNKPVIVKLSPNVTDITEIAGAAVSGGADALTIANTYLALAVDINTRRPILGNVFGGLTGPVIKPITLRLVYEVKKYLKGIPIIASGGICSATDALEFLMVGATGVQIGTMNFSTPAVMGNIIKGIAMFLESKGIEDINDFIGCIAS